MSEGSLKGEAGRVPSPFDRFTNGLFGNRIARFVSWTLFAVGLLLVLLRICVALVSSLDGLANEWLEKRLDAQITGLHGSWHGLTPQVSLDRLEFAYGSIEDVRLELDVPASLVAMAPRVRAIEVGDARLRFPEDFDLLGYLLNSNPELNLVAMVSDARFLAFRAHIGVGDDPAELLVHWVAHSNEQNRGELQLVREGQDTEQRLVLGYDLDLGLLLRDPQGAVWGSGGIHIPSSFKSLVGVSGSISSFNLDAQLVDGDLIATAKVRAEGLEVGDFRIDEAEFDTRSRGDLSGLNGEFLRASLSRADRVLDLQGARFTLEDLERWHFSLPDQRIEDLTGFIVDSAVRETAAVRWSKRFLPTGLLSSIGFQVAAREPLLISAKMSEFSAQSFNGSPSVDSVSGQIVYTFGAARVLVDTETATMGLAKLFDAPVALGRTSGEVWVRFLPNYVGMRGIDLLTNLPGGGGIEVDLSYSAPVDPFERQVLGVVRAREIPASDALQFLPKALPEGLRDWLRGGVLEGVVDEGELFLVGYVRRQPSIPTMQAELTLDFRDATLLHHPSWPVASGISGQIELVNGTLRSRIHAAKMLDESFEDVLVAMPIKGTKVQLTDAGVVQAGFLFELVKNTPLGEVLPSWSLPATGAGAVEYDLKMGVPLAFHLEELEFESSLVFDQVALGFASPKMKGSMIKVEGLNGSLDYVFPDQVVSRDLRGTLLSQPATFLFENVESRESGAKRIQARIKSELDATTLGAFSGGALAAQGKAAYQALVELNHEPDTPFRIRFESDLKGLGLDLPAGLGKTVQEPAFLILEVKLHTGFDSGEARLILSERLNGELWWSDPASDRADIRGRVAFGNVLYERHTPAYEPNRVLLEGRLPELSLQDLRRIAPRPGGLQLPEFHFSELEVGLMDLGRFALEELVLEGEWSSEVAHLKLESEHAQGVWSLAPGGVIELDMDRIHLQPRGDQDTAGVGDLLIDLDIRSLPQVDVSLASLKIGESDYGSWKFDLRHFDDGVRLANLEADSRGLSIRAPEGIFWLQTPEGEHRSHFIGELVSDDLASAMEQWGFAPSVEAESAHLVADISWPGPPWKPSLEALEGDIDLTIRRGRFRDIDATPGMKLLSLLDFNAFIRRMSFDFSDVFGEGVAFDEVHVKSRFADGSMHMIEPVKIDGNGSRFRIDGSINLETGELNNQLEATLKFSRSLPWLGAYLALLGNPVTGLGTALVERIFRNPLERISTARYEVTGTLSEPVFTLSEVEPPNPLPEELLSEEGSPEGATSSPGAPAPEGSTVEEQSEEGVPQEVPPGQGEQG